MNAKTIFRFPASLIVPLFSGALLLSGCEPGSTGTGNAGTGSTTESGVVAGRLLAPGGEPLAGAKVSLLPVDHVPSPALRKAAASGRASAAGTATLSGESVTDANGYYRFARVDSGTYALTASRDSLAYFRDSLGVGAAGLDAGTATALPTGSLAGRVRLEPGDEVRTVLILALGTQTLVVPKDTGGAFVLAGMAEGEYHVRFLSTLAAYAPFDTVLPIRSGRADTLAAPIRLRSTGIPAVTGLAAAWDAAAQAVALSWDPVDSARAAGYNVYRSEAGGLMGTAPLNAAPVRLPAYRDTTAAIGKTYAYAVKAVDKNGNVGPVLSAPATAVTEAAYAEWGYIVPGTASPTRPGLAVLQGEIYWLATDRVNVYDSTGRLLRAFGNAGPDPIVKALALRIFGDTVYVADGDYDPFDPEKSKFPQPKLRKFTRAGAAAGTLPLGPMAIDGLAGGFDFQVGAGGIIYATNGYLLYSLSPEGKADSVASPLDEFARNVFDKLEAAPGGFLLAGSYGIMDAAGRRQVTQWAGVGTDLKLGPVDSRPVFMNAFISDAQGNSWLVHDDSVAEARSPEGTITQRISLPKRLYREIQVEDGTVYLYDYEEAKIRIWRRRG